MNYDVWLQAIRAFARVEDVDPRWLERAYVADWSPERTAEEINDGNYRRFPFGAVHSDDLLRSRIRFVARMMIGVGALTSALIVATALLHGVEFANASRAIGAGSPTGKSASSYTYMFAYEAALLGAGLFQIAIGYALLERYRPA